MNSLIASINSGILYPNLIAGNFLKNKKIKNKKQAINVAIQVNSVLGGNLNKAKITKTINNIDAYYKEIKNPTKNINEVRKKTLQNEFSVVLLNNIPKKFKKFIWLPSDSGNPSFDHMQYYGMEFSLESGADGNGLLPGERPNCQCGMQLVE